MKAFLPPVLLLAALLGVSSLNCRTMENHTARWRSQLQQVQEYAEIQDWPAARAALAGSYADWCGRQTYLHIVAEHDAVDSVEAMYRRAEAFAAEEEPSEFRAELADLRDHLRLLAEMEQFSVKNFL